MAVLAAFLPGFLAVAGSEVADIVMVLNFGRKEHVFLGLPNLGVEVLDLQKLEMGLTRVISAAIF